MDQLFNYQIVGANWLKNQRFALLADEMGLGKTAQAIRGLDSVRATAAIIVCPSVARRNWAREIEKWSEVKRECVVLEKIKDAPIPNQINICSFDYAKENLSLLSKIPWDCLIVDEAHFIKNVDAQRTKALLGAKGIVRNSKRCWLLTGTPAPNHPGELWVILYTFGVTKLSYNDFLEKYCNLFKTTYGLKVTSAKKENIPELRDLLSKIMLRRKKDDVLTELPPITFGHITVEPGPVDVEVLPSFTQFFLPKDRRDELREELGRQGALLSTVFANMDRGDTEKLHTMQALSKSVSTLRRYVGLQKCPAAIEILRDELERNPNRKLVIFAIHRDVIETMRVGLKKFDPFILYGGTPPGKRDRGIYRFQHNPRCRVFIGNILASGTAITLTAAHHVVFVEQDWVPGNNAQAIMRCHRIGQDKPVHVRFILLDQTLDEKIGYILKRKVRDITAIFD